MAGTLRDELASLKIARRDVPPRAWADPRGRRDGGMGLLALAVWLIPLGPLAFAGVYGFRQYERIRSTPEVTVGLVQAMTAGEAAKLLSAKGYLKSRHQALIGVKTPVRVEKMYVEEGSKVKKGQVLAVLEHGELKAMLASRRAMLRRSEAEMIEARIDLEQKDREAVRTRRLFSSKTVSIEEFQKAEAARGMAEARVAALGAAIGLQAANVEETEESIRTMSLVAPFDGTVVERQGEEGEIITPSATSTSFSRSAVVTLASLDKMEVETDVAENLLSRIAIGQPAEILVSAVPNKRYRGKLRRIIPMGDRTRGTVKVKVEVLDPDEGLFPELVATVHFLPDQAPSNPNADRSSLFVPRAAVFEVEGHAYAWVVDGKSRLSRRRVDVAATNDDLARVESGLKAGETVVLNPTDALREDEVVKVSE
jgi:RND family efflux transporter MFP subunit